MKRSLRTWLASLVLFAAPGLAPDLIGQTFRGQPHLAPVALEARCRVADGMGDSWFEFGISPRAALTVAEDDDREIGCAMFAPVQDEAPTERLVGDSPESFCPLAFLATEEPTDVTPTDATPPQQLADLSHHVAELVEGIVTIARGTKVLATSATAASSKIHNRFVGSAPMIVLLEEEYLPYDSKLRHPFKVSLLSIKRPSYCILEPSPCSPSVNDFDIIEILPSVAQLELLDRTVRSMVSRLALDCRMEAMFYQTTDLLSRSDIVFVEYHPERLGQRFAELTSGVLDRAVTWASPAVPVLATSVVREPNPAAVPQGVQNRGGQPRAISNEFAVAGSVLVTAADELESLASRLRNWGQAMNQISGGPRLASNPSPEVD